MSGLREDGLHLEQEMERALRVDAVPAGLEARVLRGVQARMARGELDEARRGWWGARFGRGGAGAGIFGGGDWLRRGWVVGGFVTAAVAVLLVVVEVWDGGRSGLVARSSAPGVKAVRRGVIGRVGARDLSAAPAAGDRQAALSADLAEGARVAELDVSERKGDLAHAFARHGGVRREDARMAAVWVGGMPAPPMPLTEQERLLLEVVRGRSGAEDSLGTAAAGRAGVKTAALEMLNRGRQDEELARNNAEFLKFFPPPPPPPADDGYGDGAVKGEKVSGSGQAVPRGAGQDAGQRLNQIEDSGGMR